MSRCVLDDENSGNEVVIGWDSGLQTYFAQVIEAGEEKPGLWLGSLPGEYLEPDAVIDAVRPYACPFDDNVLRNNLRMDKTENSERAYGISGTQVW